MRAAVAMETDGWTRMCGWRSEADAGEAGLNKRSTRGRDRATGQASLQRLTTFLMLLYCSFEIKRGARYGHNPARRPAKAAATAQQKVVPWYESDPCRPGRLLGRPSPSVSVHPSLVCARGRAMRGKKVHLVH